MSGALVNTLLVMNLIFVFFRDAYAKANGVAESTVYTFILVRDRNQRGAGGHCGGGLYPWNRKDSDEEKYQRQTGSLEYDFSD